MRRARPLEIILGKLTFFSSFFVIYFSHKCSLFFINLLVHLFFFHNISFFIFREKRENRGDLRRDGRRIRTQNKNENENFATGLIFGKKFKSDHN